MKVCRHDSPPVCAARCPAGRTGRRPPGRPAGATRWLRTAGRATGRSWGSWGRRRARPTAWGAAAPAASGASGTRPPAAPGEGEDIALWVWGYPPPHAPQHWAHLDNNVNLTHQTLTICITKEFYLPKMGAAGHSLLFKENLREFLTACQCPSSSAALWMFLQMEMWVG